MKTYLVKIAQNNDRKAAAFESVLTNLHETLTGQQISFEIVVLGRNIGFCFSGTEAVTQIVLGQIYAMMPE
ncbi:MAG: hypothetical protein OEL89_01845, partial [Candidatus Peregrinibacteria bacterium]|nr:hypothetical protein [Candidatus Peregrinibacteria bacterium]